MAYTNILVESADGIATITFNRPKALNALNRELLGELACALEGLAADEATRVLILTGAGEKSFVAGADITEINRLNPLEAKFFARQGLAIINRLGELPFPVIAAVNGFALGGGCELALGCDFIYAAENARFGLPEINLGIIPGFGGTQRLARRVGTGRAKELIFTGRMLTAREALEMGLVNRVCAPEALMDACRETARVIAAKGRVSLRAAKQVVQQGMDCDLATGLALETDAFALCLASEDAKEGTTAFLEKRPAQFKGTFTS
jgi:enoyl-CoA hydratase